MSSARMKITFGRDACGIIAAEKAPRKSLRLINGKVSKPMIQS
jgi:hypothetical protein